MDLDFFSIYKYTKKELGQYPAILTSHLVNNPYIHLGAERQGESNMSEEEHNTMSLSWRAGPWNAQSGVEHTNHGANASPTVHCNSAYYYYNNYYGPIGCRTACLQTNHGCIFVVELRDDSTPFPVKIKENIQYMHTGILHCLTLKKNIQLRIWSWTCPRSKCAP